MKKFILFTFCLLAFTGITATVMVSTGYEVKVGEPTQTVTTARPNGNASNGDTSQGNGTLSGKELDSCLDMKLSTQADTSVSEESSGSNRYRTRVVFDVTLIEFSGYENYFNDKIEDLDKLFNDNDRTNDIYSVYEYFYDISYGKISVNVNLLLGSLPTVHYETLANSAYDYYAEIEYLNRAKSRATRLTNTYGIANADCAIYSGNIPNTNGNMLWAHAYRYLNFVALTYEHAKLGTLCHEFMHTFEIRDFYTYNSNNNNGIDSCDIMAGGSSGIKNTVAYNKLLLNWINISNYEDNVESRVEKISKNGTYTLQPASSFNGVIAYKFGVKKNDAKIYFMVEYRTKQQNSADASLLSSGLVVYRVNEHYSFQGNLQATNNDGNEVYMYPITNGYSNIIAEGDGFYNLTSADYRLMYNNKEQATITLKNIRFNDDGTASFELCDYGNNDVIAGKVVNKYCGIINPIKDVDIYMDGEKVATTATSGDFIVDTSSYKGKHTLKFVAPNGKFEFDEIVVGNDEIELNIVAKNNCYLSVSISNIANDDEVFTVYAKKYNKYVEVGTITKDKPFVTTTVYYASTGFSRISGYYILIEFKITGENIADKIIKFDCLEQSQEIDVEYIKNQNDDDNKNDIKETIKDIVTIGNIVTNPFYTLYKIARGFFK